MAGLPTHQSPVGPPAKTAAGALVFNPTYFLIILIIPTMTWVVIGAIGYSDWAPTYQNPLAGLLMILIVIHFISLVFVAFETATWWPGKIGSYVAAGLFGWGLSTSCVFIVSEWAFYYQGFFWSLSGIYIGILVENQTSVCENVAAELGASSERARRE